MSNNYSDNDSDNNSLDTTDPVDVHHDPIQDFLDTNPTIDKMVQKIKNYPLRMSAYDEK